MTDNIKTLLSYSTTQEEKINATNTIITNYNLHLTTKEIMSVFSKARLEIYYYLHNFSSYKFLFKYLFDQNIDMFIAISKCCSDKEKTCPYWMLSWFISSGGNLYIGSNHLYSNDGIINVYKILLDYHNFNIDDLKIPVECRKQIQEYNNEKYCGRLTKVAKK